MLLTRRDEGGDVKVHFREINRLHQVLMGMGDKIVDTDYATIIMESLPDSYRSIILSLEAATGYASKVVTPQDSEIITAVMVEYEHWLIRNSQSARKGGNAALTAGTSEHQGRKATKDTVCFNCEKKGHFKSDCWAKGGGKEGQRPAGQGCRNGNKETASAAVSTPAPPQENYAFSASAPTNVGRRGAIIDSRATSHFCPDRTRFTMFEAIPPQDVQTADGSTISALGCGDIQVELPLEEKRTTVTLKNILYTPKMALTLISTNRIVAAGYAVHFENKHCKILVPAPRRKLIASIPQINGLYIVPAQAEESANVAKLTVYELHRVLGHVAQGAVLHVVKTGLIEGVELNSASTPEFCKACTKAKVACQPFLQETKN